MHCFDRAELRSSFQMLSKHSRAVCSRRMLVVPLQSLHVASALPHDSKETQHFLVLKQIERTARAGDAAACPTLHYELETWELQGPYSFGMPPPPPTFTRSERANPLRRSVERASRAEPALEAMRQCVLFCTNALRLARPRRPRSMPPQ